MLQMMTASIAKLQSRKLILIVGGTLLLGLAVAMFWIHIRDRYGPMLDRSYPELDAVRALAKDDGTEEWMARAVAAVSGLEIRSDVHAVVGVSLMMAVNRRQQTYTKAQMIALIRRGIEAEDEVVDRTIRYRPDIILGRLRMPPDDPVMLPLIRSCLGDVQGYREAYRRLFDAEDWAGLEGFVARLKAEVDDQPADKRPGIIVFVTTAFPPNLIGKWIKGMP